MKSLQEFYLHLTEPLLDPTETTDTLNVTLLDLLMLLKMLVSERANALYPQTMESSEILAMELTKLLQFHINADTTHKPRT